jgi:hypothetical protein
MIKIETAIGTVHVRPMNRSISQMDTHNALYELIARLLLEEYKAAK